MRSTSFTIHAALRTTSCSKSLSASRGHRCPSPSSCPRREEGRAAGMRNLATYRLICFLFIGLSVFAAGDLRGQEDQPHTVVSVFQDELLTTMKQAKTLGFEG